MKRSDHVPLSVRQIRRRTRLVRVTLTLLMVAFAAIIFFIVPIVSNGAMEVFAITAYVVLLMSIFSQCDSLVRGL